MNNTEIAALIRDSGAIPVVSVSGGKDSSATALYVSRDLGLECRFVFADTGWEAPETYQHIDALELLVGRIDRVGVLGGFKQVAARDAHAPMRLRRWCTRALKVKPIAAMLRDIEDSTGRTVVNVVGVRAQESKARASLPRWEDCAGTDIDCFVWRPLLDWSTEQVLDTHHRHGFSINPLYRKGFDRVGCFPCILSTKEDIRLVAEHAPWRIDEIEEMERSWTAERIRRNAETPGRHSVEVATFFQKENTDGTAAGIREVVEWAQTSRGGKQLPLLPEDPRGGCFRWGVCDAPTAR